MFDNDFDITVSFLSGHDHLITAGNVTGDGMSLIIRKNRAKEPTEIELNPEDVQKLLEILTEANRYIRENE